MIVASSVHMFVKSFIRSIMLLILTLRNILANNIYNPSALLSILSYKLIDDNSTYSSTVLFLHFCCTSM